MDTANEPATLPRHSRGKARHRERMRRHRQRQRAGQLSITMDVTRDETAKLCRLRYLTEHELEDRTRIAEAVHELLANIVIDDL